MRIRRAVQLFRGEREFHMDIVGRRRLWFLISGALLAISAAALVVRGLNLSIDFEGGALLRYENTAGLSVPDVQETLAEVGHEDAVVQLAADGREVTIRTESLGSDRTEVLEALSGQAGVPTSAVTVEDVGPKWGQQISAKALQGLIIFLIAVSIYIAFRFEWKMAAAALVALFHDLIITAGVYALVGREVTPETVIAILTILGYSLYDTVVIFDKIKENTESLSLVARETYSGTVNLSLNQVFMRSINTSLATLLPVGALMFFGGEVLQSFAFALFVGLVLGAYSSVFIAAPVVAVLKEREPRLAQFRERAARRPPRPALRPVPAEGPSGDGEPAVASVAAPPARTSTSTSARAPVRRKPKKKPRSKRKKR
jgi:preprotein translocase subunit SecF